MSEQPTDSHSTDAIEPASPNQAAPLEPTVSRPAENPNPLPRIPDLDSELPASLHERKTALVNRMESLYHDEALRAQKLAEIAGHSIEKPPTWKERETLEKAKIDFLKRRAELCDDLFAFAIECHHGIGTLRNALETDSAIQDQIAEKLRGVGCPIERRGGPNGPFVDSRPQCYSVPWNGVIRAHPEVVENRQRRESLTGAVWHHFEDLVSESNARALEALERERRRIMEVA